MSYQSVSEMVSSDSLRRRLAACASQEFFSRGYREANVLGWVDHNAWLLCSAPGWSGQWDSGKVAYPGEDLGARNDVITDGDILSSVQPLVAEDTQEPT